MTIHTGLKMHHFIMEVDVSTSMCCLKMLEHVWTHAIYVDCLAEKMWYPDCNWKWGMKPWIPQPLLCLSPVFVWKLVNDDDDDGDDGDDGDDDEDDQPSSVISRHRKSSSMFRIVSFNMTLRSPYYQANILKPVHDIDHQQVLIIDNEDLQGKPYIYNI